MTVLATTVELGSGHAACFVWRDDRVDRERSVPMGIVERHGGCRVFVPWVAEDGEDFSAVWSLDSLTPLTVRPSMVCPNCGAHGRIRDGRWEPVTT